MLQFKFRELNLIKYFILIFILLFPILGITDSLSPLKQFVQLTKSASCEFNQTIFNKSGKIIQKSSGIFKFNRPNQFYWEFNKSIHQLIVSDGIKIWIYDSELKQVTSKPFSKTLGQSPASLLAGDDQIEKHFKIVALPTESRSNLNWLEAIPKQNKDVQFEKIKLGFRKNILYEIELYDNFGQKTIIEFSNFKLNMKFNAQEFRFNIPSGVDLIEE